MIFSIIAIIIGMLIMAWFRNSSYLDIVVAITIIIMTFTFMIDISKSKRLKNYSAPLSIGWMLRVVLVFYDAYSSDPLHLPLVGGELTSDPLGFFRSAVNFSNGYRIRYGGNFSKLLGSIFRITGGTRLLGDFVVCLFSIATILVLIIILEEIDAPVNDKKRGVYLICLLPNYAFMSAIIRRETVITFFISLSILWFIRWIKSKKQIDGDKAFFLSIIFALIASLFHGATGLIAASYILIRIIYSPARNKFTLDSKNIAGAIAFIALLLVAYSMYGNTFFDKLEDTVKEGTLSTQRDAGGSSYAQFVGDAKNPARMLVFQIPRFVYFMFSPFPWQWRGISDIIAFFFSSYIYLIILINSIRYIKNSPKDDFNRKILIALLIVSVMTAAIFSWGVTNTGTATRHRDKFIVIFTLMYVLSMRIKPLIIRRIKIKMN